MTDAQVVEAYERTFGTINPPLDYGQVYVPLPELVALARTALDEGRPIPWDELLAPLPDGADS